MKTVERYRGYEIVTDGKRFRVELEGTRALLVFASVEEARAEIDSAEAIWAEWESAGVSRGYAASR